jgi:hypothetical protein
MADIHKLRPQGGGSTKSSAPLDLIDALDRQVTFCRGVIDAFAGASIGFEDDMQGAFAVAEAHYDALKAIARIAAGKGPDDDDDTEGDAS